MNYSIVKVGSVWKRKELEEEEEANSEMPKYYLVLRFVGQNASPTFPGSLIVLDDEGVEEEIGSDYLRGWYRKLYK